MLRALSSIDELWNAETRETNKSPSDLSRMAAYRIDQILLERKEASAQLGKNVTFWIEAFSAKVNCPFCFEVSTIPLPFLRLRI